MRAEKIVQFVYFETSLDKDEFLVQWEQYTRSVNSDVNVTLQQSSHNGTFRYLSQHRCPAGEFQFVFTKAKRASRLPEPGINGKQAGGYSILQETRTQDTHSDESKIFVFLVDPPSDLDVFRKISPTGKLNIYEAYYENCKYAYILEYYVKDKNASALIEQMKSLRTDGIGRYKECAIHAY
jgi:hypothetical protein